MFLRRRFWEEWFLFVGMLWEGGVGADALGRRFWGGCSGKEVVGNRFWGRGFGAYGGRGGLGKEVLRENVFEKEVLGGVVSFCRDALGRRFWGGCFGKEVLGRMFWEGGFWEKVLGKSFFFWGGDGGRGGLGKEVLREYFLGGSFGRSCFCFGGMFLEGGFGEEVLGRRFCGRFVFFGRFLGKGLGKRFWRRGFGGYGGRGGLGGGFARDYDGRPVAGLERPSEPTPMTQALGQCSSFTPRCSGGWGKSDQETETLVREHFCFPVLGRGFGKEVFSRRRVFGEAVVWVGGGEVWAGGFGGSSDENVPFRMSRHA